MRGYEKQPLIYKEKHAFTSIALDKSTRLENCACKESTLRTDGGTVAFPVAGKTAYLTSNLPMPYQFFRIPCDNGEAGLGYVSENGNVLRFDQTSGAFVGVHNFSTRMRAVCAFDDRRKERLLLIGNKGVYEYVEATKSFTLILQDTEEIAPIACVCKDRVFFVIKPHTIVYSAPLLPINFTVSAEEGGRIDFPYDKGEIVAIAPHGRGLAIFYEYGVAVLETDGSARDFVWKTVAYGGGRIIADSAGNAGVGGEKTFFLADDGAYVLDGNTVRNVCKNMNIRPKSVGQVCEHAESQGRYYAVYGNQKGEREGIVIDTQSETGAFAFAPRGLSVCGGVAVCMTSGWRVSAMGGDDLPLGAYARAEFEGLDFSYAGRKTLRIVKVYGEGTLELEVKQGNNSKRYTLTTLNGEATANVRLRGDRFSLYCRLSGGTLVRAIVAEWTALASVRVKEERGRRTYGN